MLTRKIHKGIVDDFISKGMIYQSANFKNSVFVGYDKDNERMHLNEVSLKILNWIMLEVIKHLVSTTQM